MQGMTNSGGITAYRAKQALALAQMATGQGGSGGTGGGSVDEGSTVAFSLGYDENGFYVNTPDETVETNENTETEETNNG